MNENRYIFGSGGFAREVKFVLNYFTFDNFIFVDSGEKECDDTISEEAFFVSAKKASGKPIECYIAIGDPTIRMNVYEKIINENLNVCFPNAIHPNLISDVLNTKFGKGNIILPNVCLTTNIKLGNFNIINLGSTVGYDTTIGDYNTISPGCNISGNVHIEDLSYLGTNCSTVENITIGSEIKFDAGAVVTKSIFDKGFYAGNPAKRVK